LATNLYKKVASWPAARLIIAKAISAARPFCSLDHGMEKVDPFEGGAEFRQLSC